MAFIVIIICTSSLFIIFFVWWIRWIRTWQTWIWIRIRWYVWYRMEWVVVRRSISFRCHDLCWWVMWWWWRMTRYPIQKYWWSGYQRRCMYQIYWWWQYFVLLHGCWLNHGLIRCLSSFMEQVDSSCCDSYQLESNQNVCDSKLQNCCPQFFN